MRGLPGWDAPLPSRHFSGYVDVAADGAPADMLHYWLVEAEKVAPEAAPLVLWLNGGPGCSSMTGMFQELGPFRVNAKDHRKLDRNPHTWARIANLLFLEAPIGVGFSYTEEPGFGAEVTVNDNSTAEMSYQFLQAWLG